VQAVVLVGGLGTRLRPLTETIPKQLLPIAGVPMIERVLIQLADHGVDRAVLSMGYLPDPFIEAYPDKRIGGVDVTFAIESHPLGTAGAIRYAASTCGIDDTFLAVNGDVLTDLDVTALVALHHTRRGEATIHLTPVLDPSRYGVVVTDEHGRVLEFVEKPPAGTAPTNNINAGTYVLEPSFLERVTPDAAVSVETQVFPEMVEHGTLFAMHDASYWLDAGTPSSYLQANTDVLDGARKYTRSSTAHGTSLVHTSASVASTATLERSVLANHVVIEDGAVVRGSVVLEGARIGVGATVLDSVVGPGATVGSGSALSANYLVARDARVPEGARLDGVPVAT
jgi:mannose-1-phosphate guanylyltransferase